MTSEMRKKLARLPYAEKLRRVAELIAFSRQFKMANNPKEKKDAEVRAKA